MVISMIILFKHYNPFINYLFIQYIF